MLVEWTEPPAMSATAPAGPGGGCRGVLRATAAISPAHALAALAHHC